MRYIACVLLGKRRIFPALNFFHFLVPEPAEDHRIQRLAGLPATRTAFETRACLDESQSTYFYANLLQTCIHRKLIKSGKQIHARLLLKGIVINTELSCKLVNLYSFCNSIMDARYVFDRSPQRTVFLWNVLIRGYAWNGPHEVAITLYHKMVKSGSEPDNFTFPFVLKACSSLRALEEGRHIHQHVMHTGWASDAFVGAALVDMYAKGGCVQTCREIFNVITNKDVVLWNSIMAAYSHNGHPSEALSLFRDMNGAHFPPTEATLVIIISASSNSAKFHRGREIHGFSWRRGYGSHDKVNTALIDMYAKCGLLEVAQRLFESLREKRVVSWNAMITGYAMHGRACAALSLYEEMSQGKFRPDHITFVGILSACSHGGLLNEGQKYFDQMVRDYSIKPRVQHYTCMVDLLSHFGKLKEAHDLIARMEVPPDSGIWGALLHSCKLHGNIDLAEVALQNLVQLDPNDAGNYVILSNLYADAGNWEGVATTRKLMTERGLRKTIACSWIEVNKKLHAFLAGDMSHPRSDDIYKELKRLGALMKAAGYVPDTGSVFHDVDEDEKLNMVSSHSERLAVSFGLISTPPGTKLLVTKNLRICDDCHTAIKFISKIVEREIVIRDVNRYHHFKDGECLCGGYW